MEILLEKLIEEKKNYVLIGEAGSGKTELAVSLACALMGKDRRSVHLFDMDQTKPLLRARDAAERLARRGVVLHFQEQYLDTPVVASGVRESLQDPEKCVLLDVGGGAYGAHMIGQFSEELNTGETEVLYLVNPYRPWSGSEENIAETMGRVLGAAGLVRYSIVANPNVGRQTDAAAVRRGLEAVRQLFPCREIKFVCAMESLCRELRETETIPVFALQADITPSWLR